MTGQQPSPGRLAVDTLGTGPALAWLHGYTMDSRTWRQLWSLLPGWRHVGIDLPGHGRSAPLLRGTTLGRVAEDVAATMTATGAEGLVALSFGTIVALQVAIDHPRTVPAMVLAAPHIGGWPSEPGADVHYRKVIGAFFAGLRGEELADVWMQAPPDIFRGTEGHPELRGRLRTVIGEHTWAELFDGSMAPLALHPQPDEALRTVSADVRVLVGTDDMPSTVACAEHLATVLPRCRLTRLPDAGHLGLLERPEAAAAVLAQHFATADQ